MSLLLACGAGLLIAPTVASANDATPQAVSRLFSVIASHCPDATWSANGDGTRWTARCANDARTRVVFSVDGNIVRWANDVAATTNDVEAAQAASGFGEPYRIRRVERVNASTGDVAVSYTCFTRNDEGRTEWSSYEPNGSWRQSVFFASFEEVPSAVSDDAASRGDDVAWTKVVSTTRATSYRVRYEGECGTYVVRYDAEGEIRSEGTCR